MPSGFHALSPAGAYKYALSRIFEYFLKITSITGEIACRLWYNVGTLDCSAFRFQAGVLVFMKKVDLLEGSIVRSLTRLALPIMATSLIQMAYNMTDMIWIGRVSSNAVAAVGAAGMYLWLANGLAMIPRLGGQVKAAHELGAQNTERAAAYGQAAFHMGALLAVLFTALCILLNGPLIAFFNLSSPSVIADARTYLIIVAAGFAFSFFNQIFTGLFTAMGGSVVVLRATAVGLVGNIVLDPLMIFGVGPFPQMGVAGAALATVLAQAIVTVMFLLAARRETALFPHIHLLRASRRQVWKEILKIGLPVSIQSMFFSALSMIIARIISGWGDAAIAAQKVGSQIESISYTTAEGFATALNAFIAQNFGAGKKDRIHKGFRTAIGMMILWSCFTTVLLIAFPAPLVQIFIQGDEQVLQIGVSYLRIMGFSQILMCLEIASSGAFQGLGRPMPPSLVGVIGNAARIPLSILLSATVLGLDGVWWSISISSIAKGTVLFIWLIVILRRYIRADGTRLPTAPARFRPRRSEPRGG